VQGYVDRDNNVRLNSATLTGPAVRTQTLRLSRKYQDTIIDTGGQEAEKVPGLTCYLSSRQYI
jgi:hypothetical protein